MGLTPQSFTTGEASRATGVKPRTLDHWARTGFIAPSITAANGTGSERRYSFADLVALRTARILRSGGIETEALKSAVGMIQARSDYAHGLMTVTPVGVCIARSSKELVHTAKYEDYVIVVDLARIAADVKAEIAKNPNRKKVA